MLADISRCPISAKRFMSAYTRFSILYSIVESLVSGTQLDLPQNHISRFLQITRSTEIDENEFLSSLFCVCLTLGPESLFGAEGT
jgi:hypothetical protein